MSKFPHFKNKMSVGGGKVTYKTVSDEVSVIVILIVNGTQFWQPKQYSLKTTSHKSIFLSLRAFTHRPEEKAFKGNSIVFDNKVHYSNLTFPRVHIQYFLVSDQTITIMKSLPLFIKIICE